MPEVEVPVTSDWPLVTPAVRFVAGVAGCSIDLSGVTFRDDTTSGLLLQSDGTTGTHVAPDGFDYGVYKSRLSARHLKALQLLWKQALAPAGRVIAREWERRLRRALEKSQGALPPLPAAEPDSPHESPSEDSSEGEEIDLSELDCATVVVSGAGDTGFNGSYNRVPQLRNGKSVWTRHDGPGYAIVWHSAGPGGVTGGWGLHRRSFEPTHVFYRNNNNTPFPPRRGWKCTQGMEPAPVLNPPGYDPPKRTAGAARRAKRVRQGSQGKGAAAAVVSGEVGWSCDLNDSGDYHAYIQQDAVAIEQAFREANGTGLSRQLNLSFAPFPYVFNFADMTQVNLQSGQKRKVRRKGPALTNTLNAVSDDEGLARRILEYFDKDKDGRLNVQELGEFLKTSEVPGSEMPELVRQGMVVGLIQQHGDQGSLGPQGLQEFIKNLSTVEPPRAQRLLALFPAESSPALSRSARKRVDIICQGHGYSFKRLLPPNISVSTAQMPEARKFREGDQVEISDPRLGSVVQSGTVIGYGAKGAYIVRVEEGDTVLVRDEQLKRGGGADKDRTPKLRVDDEVVLCDAALGELQDEEAALRPGEKGRIIDTDRSEVPFLVKGPRGECSWYRKVEITHPQPRPAMLSEFVDQAVDPDGRVVEATDPSTGKRTRLALELCFSRELGNELGDDDEVHFLFDSSFRGVYPTQPSGVEGDSQEERQSAVAWTGADPSERNKTAAATFKKGDAVRTLPFCDDMVHMRNFSGRGSCGRDGVVVGHKRSQGLLRIRLDEVDDGSTLPRQLSEVQGDQWWEARLVAHRVTGWRSTGVCGGIVKLTGTPEQLRNAQAIIPGLDTLFVTDAPSSRLAVELAKTLPDVARGSGKAIFYRTVRAKDDSSRTGWLIVTAAGQAKVLAEAMSGNLQGFMCNAKEDLVRKGLMLVERHTTSIVVQAEGRFVVLGREPGRSKAEKILRTLNEVREILVRVPVVDGPLVDAHRKEIQRVSQAHVVVSRGSLVQLTGTPSHVRRARMAINALLKHHWRETQLRRGSRVLLQVANSQAEVRVCVRLRRAAALLRRAREVREASPVTEEPLVGLPNRGAVEEEARRERETMQRSVKQQLRDVGLQAAQAASAGSCPKCQANNLQDRRSTAQRMDCDTCTTRAVVHCNGCSGDWCAHHANLKEFRVTPAIQGDMEAAVCAQRAMAVYDIGNKGYLTCSEFTVMFSAMLRRSGAPAGSEEEYVRISTSEYKELMGNTTDPEAVLDVTRLRRFLEDGQVGRRRMDILDPLLPKLPPADRRAYLPVCPAAAKPSEAIEARFRAHLQQLIDSFDSVHFVRAEWSENLASAAGNARGRLAALVSIRGKAEAAVAGGAEQLRIDMTEIDATLQSLTEAESELGESAEMGVRIRTTEGRRLSFRHASGPAPLELRVGEHTEAERVIGITLDQTMMSVVCASSPPDRQLQFSIPKERGSVVGLCFDGPVITSVEPGTKVASTGLRAGMRVMSIAGLAVGVETSTAEVSQRLHAVQHDTIDVIVTSPVRVSIKDQREELYRLHELSQGAGVNVTGLPESAGEESSLCKAVRLVPRKTRGGTEQTCQIQKLELFDSSGGILKLHAASGGENAEGFATGKETWRGGADSALTVHLEEPGHRVSAYRIQTADNAPEKDLAAWTLEGLVSTGQLAEPRCPQGCVMKVIDWNGGMYMGQGWVCNTCRYNGGPRERRWCCKEHYDDYCLRCKPPGPATEWIPLHEHADASSVPTDRGAWTETFRVQREVRWWSVDSRAAVVRVLREVRLDMLSLHEFLCDRKNNLVSIVRDGVARLRRLLVDDARQGKWVLQEQLLATCGCLIDAQDDERVNVYGPPPGVRRALKLLKHADAAPWPPEDVPVSAFIAVGKEMLTYLQSQHSRLLQSALAAGSLQELSIDTVKSGVKAVGFAASIRDSHAVMQSLSRGTGTVGEIEWETDPCPPATEEEQAVCVTCCCDIETDQKHVTLVCGHMLCGECCGGFLTEWKASSFKGVPQCPAQYQDSRGACPYVVGVEDFCALRDAAPDGSDVKSLDPRRYEDLRLAVALRDTGLAVQCPTPDCPGVALVEHQGSHGNLYCLECESLFCPGGGMAHEAHFFSSCPQVRDIADEQHGRQDRGTRRLLETMARPCPGKGCGMLITRDRGCAHMICHACRTEFCWYCLKPYSADGLEAVAMRRGYGPAYYKCDCNPQGGAEPTRDHAHLQERIHKTMSLHRGVLYYGYTSCDACGSPIGKETDAFACLNCLNHYLCGACKAEGKTCGYENHVSAPLPREEPPPQGFAEKTDSSIAQQEPSVPIRRYADFQWKQEMRCQLPWLAGTRISVGEMSRRSTFDDLARKATDSDTPLTRDMSFTSTLGFDWSDEEDDAKAASESSSDASGNEPSPAPMSLTRTSTALSDGNMQQGGVRIDLGGLPANCLQQ
eukprot:Hpha_TRINITY_DN15939_c0_g3::TRINITY_DN15939_c0_g3_i1::g.71661::m.71661